MRTRRVSPAKLVVFWAWEQRKWAFIFRKIVDNYHDEAAVLVVPYTSCRRRHHHQKVQKLQSRREETEMLGQVPLFFKRQRSSKTTPSRCLTGKWSQFPWKNRHQVESGNVIDWKNSSCLMIPHDIQRRQMNCSLAFASSLQAVIH